MTPEQRYLFDALGYLHLRAVITGETLERAQQAADAYVHADPESLPPGCGIERGRPTLDRYLRVFGWDKSLEALTMHPAVWPIIREVTGDRPRLLTGHMLNLRREHQFHALHSAREQNDFPGSPRMFLHRGKLLCDYIVVFWYLSDVRPGDGGLIVVPGSHKSELDRPPGVFFPDGPGEELPTGVVHVAPKAGDVVIITEALTHGALPWRADHDRRCLVYRYVPQHLRFWDGETHLAPEEMMERLSPATRELLEPAPFRVVKRIVQEEPVAD